MRISLFSCFLVAVLGSDLGENQFEWSTSSDISGPLTICGGDRKVFALEKYSLTPFPPVVGQNMHFTATGLLSVPITNGSAFEITAKWGRLPVPVLKEVHDFCTKSAANGSPCPIKPGKFTFTYDQFIPANLPLLSVSITINFFDSNRNLVLCLGGPVQLTSESSLHKGRK